MSRPNKYRMLGEKARRESPAIEANLALDGRSSERFEKYTNDGSVGGTFNLDLGERHRLQLPANARTHYIWTASGAYYHDNVNNRWAVQGRVIFLRGNKPVGEFFFEDCSPTVAAYAAFLDTAPRRIFRNRSNGDGSTLPVLNYQEFDSSTAVRDNLDMPCTPYAMQADALAFVIDYGRVEINFASPVNMLLGLRVTSTL